MGTSGRIHSPRCRRRTRFLNPRHAATEHATLKNVSPLVSGVGAAWLLTLGVAAWLYGDPNNMETDTVPHSLPVVVALLGVASVCLGAVLVRSKRGLWSFAVVALGSIFGTALTTANSMRGQPDTLYPSIVFLIYVVFLGIGFTVGAVIGRLWRLSDSRHQRGVPHA